MADGSDFDIWIIDVASGRSSRLTQTGGYRPAWTPDGKRIAFQGKDDQFLWMPVDGSAPAEPLPGTAGLPVHSYFKTRISADGRYAVLLRGAIPGDPPGGAHGVVVPLAGGELTPFLAGTNTPLDFDLSPDGRWIAYESRETGRHEVSIRSFPGGSAKLQLTTEGGDTPRWTEGGRKLVYHDDKAYHEVTLDLSGAAPRVVRTDTLFSTRDNSGLPVLSNSVSADGKHFVVKHPLGEATRLVVVQNWITEVRARLADR